MAEPEQLDTTSPVARAAKISEATLRLWARTGLVPFRLTSSGMRLFALDDVLRVARDRAARRANQRGGGRAA
jgi:DNA-binding transcriptional MerR regulator